MHPPGAGSVPADDLPRPRRCPQLKEAALPKVGLLWAGGIQGLALMGIKSPVPLPQFRHL